MQEKLNVFCTGVKNPVLVADSLLRTQMHGEMSLGRVPPRSVYAMLCTVLKYVSNNNNNNNSNKLKEKQIFVTDSVTHVCSSHSQNNGSHQQRQYRQYGHPHNHQG